MKKFVVIHIVLFIFLIVCGYDKSNIKRMELEKWRIAYTFLLNKLNNQNYNLIASINNENINTVKKVINENNLNLEIEDYSNLEKHSDLCYYSKSTKRLVVVISVLKRDENKYYVSYYIGPEGGASKEIEIIKRKGRWTVANDDERWIVK